MSQGDALKMAAALIKQAEGLRLRPYRCPAGVPTIGYGSTRYADGKAVTLKDPAITQAQADELLMVTLQQEYLPGVLKASPTLADKPKALAAILDFAYNLGVAAYEKSTLRKWIKAGGKVLPGLVARRDAEALLLK